MAARPVFRSDYAYTCRSGYRCGYRQYVPGREKSRFRQ